MSVLYDPLGVRTVKPSTWPQYPFDSPPKVSKFSKPGYTIFEEADVRIPMRDGVKLAADIFRPSAPGQKFPGLLAVSAYSRQIPRTALPLGQNEAGITEFWVPRGYAQVIVDVRGSNESEGSWDMMGPQEQRDLFDLVEWIAEQPWCDGNVGMTGCSYFGWSQLMAATQRPPHLKAIFAFDAAIDLYREAFFHGGIFTSGFPNRWFEALRAENLLGGQLKDPSGMLRHFKTVLSCEYPFDGPYYQERLSWTRLNRVQIPVYFACDWTFYSLHLRGAFEGWESVGNVPKRMLIGPKLVPFRPMKAYHYEALRWYDYYLKEMDTRVMDGLPIQLYIPGQDRWRGEREWPLARTQWRQFFLAGEAGKGERRLVDDTGPDSFGIYDYDPSGSEALLGRPKLVYRSEPLSCDLEVTGPLALYLWASSTASDTDWFVNFKDEAPDGQLHELTRGWLRASHRELDTARSKTWRPFHPHVKAEPLTAKEAYEFAIEIWPTSKLFKAGHRLRLEIASCDDQSDPKRYHRALARPASNTILEGRSYPSRLLVPVIPSQ